MISNPKLQQHFIPDYSYCLICGVEDEWETCSTSCNNKLVFLRETIKNRKKMEKEGSRGWDEKTIRTFSQLQTILK